MSESQTSAWTPPFEEWMAVNPQAILAVDRKGVIHYFNIRAAALFGACPEELKTLHATSLFGAGVFETLLQQFSDRTEIQLPLLQFRKFSGTPFTGSLSGKSIPLGAKEGFLFYISQDERHVDSDQRALELETEYQQLFEGNPVATILWNRNSIITAMNPAAIDLFCCSGESYIGLPVSSLLHYAHPSASLPDPEAILSGEHFQGVHWKYERNECQFELESSFIPRRDSSGSVVGGVILTRDVSIWNAAQREWKTRSSQLSGLLKAASRLSLVHDPQVKLDQSLNELFQLELFNAGFILYFPNLEIVSNCSFAGTDLAARTSSAQTLLSKEKSHNVLIESILQFYEQGQKTGNCSYIPAIFDAVPLDLFTFARKAKHSQSRGKIEPVNWLLVPFQDRNDQVVGMLFLLDTKDRLPPQPDVFQLIELFTRLISAQLEQHRLLNASITSQQRYHALIDQLGEGVVVADAKGCIVIVNPALCGIVKYDASEMYGKPEKMLFPEEEHSKIIAATLDRKNRISAQYEAKIRRGDGVIRLAHISATPLVDLHGEYYGSLALLTDITDRRADELALRQANVELEATSKFAMMIAERLSMQSIETVKLQRLINSANKKSGHQAGYASHSMEDIELLSQSTSTLEQAALEILLEVSSSEFGAVFQKEPDETNFRFATSILSPTSTLVKNDLRGLSNICQRLLTGKATSFFAADTFADARFTPEEHTLLGEKNVRSFLLFELNARDLQIGYIFLGSHSATSYSLTTLQFLRTLTEQLSLALDNSELLRALLKASSDWASAFDSLPDPVFVLRSDGKVRRSNVAASQLSGINVREMVGKPLPELLNEFGKRLLSLPAEVNELEETHPINDISRTFSITIVPLPQAERLMLLRDVTERKFLQDQMYEAQRRELIVRFAGGIAHDFNNLLVGIVGAADVLSIRLADQSEHLELLAILHSSAKRASELVRQLLAYARGGTTQISLVDVNNVIREVRKLLSITKPPDVEIKLELSETLPKVRLDETQLQQVVMNLCLNAIEALHGKGIITVYTSVDPIPDAYATLDFPSEGLRICVIDNGKGFPPQILSRPGEPFNSTKGTGRGLGMAAVYGIVARHSGKIFLSNRPEGGACVEIFFPDLAEVAQELEEPNISEASPATAGLEKKRILVVDDELMVRSLVREVLEMFGCEVTEATDGVEGLEQFQRSNYDLILLDIIMPRLGGIEAYREIRKLNSTIPILFVSGYDESDSVMRLSDTHVRFLQKPFLVNELFGAASQIAKLDLPDVPL